MERISEAVDANGVITKGRFVLLLDVRVVIFPSGMGAASSKRMGQHTYSELLGDIVDGWHHYAVSWSNALSTPSVSFIDGNLVQMEVSYHGSLKQAIFENNATVLSLPNDPSVDNGTQPQSSFTIDELKIRDYCKKDISSGD